MQVSVSEWPISTGVMDKVSAVAAELGAYFDENKEAIARLVEGGLSVMNY